MAVDYVASWVNRLRGRLYEQFKGELSWQQWCTLLGRQFQDLEDAAQSLFTITSINDSEGVQLDVIGRIVGQLRLAVSDAIYRRYLRARILASRSSGTAEDLYKVFMAMLNQVGTLELEQAFPAGFTLNVLTPALSDQEMAVAYDLLRDSKSAGVAAWLTWSAYQPETTFTLEDRPSTYLTAASLAGASVVQVASTAGFPGTGTLWFDEGLSSEETGFSYTVTDATHFTMTISNLFLPHDLGATVRLDDGVSSLKGWGEGYLRGVILAE